MKLKNCPFCGSETYIEEFDDDNPIRRVSCKADDCPGAHTWQDNKDQAVSMWNTRADGWISVKDQIPGKEKFIMACNIRRIPDTLRIINPIFLTPAYTHWMPLPQIQDAEEDV